MNQMEKKNFGYSLKNIPIPSEDSYMKCMISKLENFIRRVRWKSFFFNKVTTTKETYGFNSEHAPPADKELTAFENDLYDMVHSIKFKKVQNSFQKQLSKDVKEINSSTNVYIPADKTTNIYKVSKQYYNKLLKDNITTNYKKAPRNTRINIDREAKEIAQKLKLDDRIERFPNKPAFLSLKDHKDNFENNPKCRLLNPAKSEIGIISKHHLQRINNELRTSLGINQWRNSAGVIDWFCSITDKNNCKFVQFDIVEFYPSISEELLTKALNFAKSKLQVSNEEIRIIQHSRKSLLFESDNTWIKKNNSLFDVTMGSYDGAEVCDLIGLYLLYEMRTKFGEVELGLYRDDGLGYYKNIPGPQSERLKKRIVRFFRDNGLNLTIEFNMNKVNFLDVTFDMDSGKYWPYMKPNDQPLYIHKESNHPPGIIKQLPKMIEKRISGISCDEQEFNKVKDEYDKALKNSGFREKIKYTQPNPRRPTRKRKVIWFNPPYNTNVDTNVGRVFLNIVKKHFTPRHKLYKIFNKNTIKISYSCMPSIKSVIAKHNKKVLSDEAIPENKRTCNCPRNNRDRCPLDGECLSESIVYKANVTTPINTKDYTGATQPPFKKRLAVHKHSFVNRKREVDTCLSRYIWELKDNNINFEIKWNLHRQAYPYQCGSRKCDLCLTEKLEILKSDPTRSLNKRSEIMNKCLHRNGCKLSGVG